MLFKKPDYKYYYGSYLETFIGQQYKWLCTNLKLNTIAIDLGAQTGDSAFYMLQQGIKYIAAFEPDKQAYSQLYKNITRFNAQNYIKAFFDSAPEPFIFPSDKPTILKCDIEGAEYKVFSKKAILKNIYKIQIEYHNAPQDISHILKSKGFKVKTDIPYAKTPYGTDIGWIYAWK